MTVEEDDQRLFYFLHWQTGAEFNESDSVRVHGISWPRIPPFTITFREFNIQLSVNFNEQTSTFNYRGQSFTTKLHGHGHQLCQSGIAKPLGYLVESWKDTETREKIIYTMYVDPDVDNTLLMILLLAPFSDQSRHALGAGPPLFKPDL